MKNFFQTAFTALLFAVLFTNCQQDDTALDELAVEQQPTEPAQSLRKCATDEVYQQMMVNEPGFRGNRLKIEKFTREYLASNPLNDRSVISIPVVVHVLWKTSVQNISDAQIQSQINVLNQDFRRLNADAANTPVPFQPLAADAEVEFCLATRAPNGTATNGIERRQTTVTSFRTNDNMKHYSSGGLDAWDASQYLNIWACNLSGGILGYAQFPGGSPANDGVVITYTAFGTTGTAQAPFNLGRTATHEVGHWLNLYHIWGDDGTSCSGSDEVADTPNQGSENYGCPPFPTITCSNGPNGDMFMNYMDYTDDGCMNVYSQGQKSRMNALFASNGPRYGLLSSNGCNTPGGGGSCISPAGAAASNITTNSATVSWNAVADANSYNLQYKPSTASSWTTISNIAGTSKGLTGLSPSTGYDFAVQTNCASASSAYSSSTSFTTLADSGPACADNYEPNNSSNKAKLIPANTNITAQIGAVNDADWFKFSNSLTAKNIRISLTNLPKDYDVYLYKNNILVGYSENPDNESEEIIYNSNRVATYKIKVVGWDGAFSASQCYTLRADISNSPFRITGNNQRVSKKK